MKSEKDQIQWDYFLNNYERDLLRLPFDEAVQKYPFMSPEQMKSDFVQLVENTGLSIDKIKQLVETAKK